MDSTNDEKLDTAIQHRQKNNQQTNENTTMSTTQDTTETQHPYSHVASMIGDAITTTDYGVHMSGDYIVERTDDDGIAIYRVSDDAATEDELEGDITVQMGGRWYAGRDAGYLAPPEDGWEAEVDLLPEEFWGGYK